MIESLQTYIHTDIYNESKDNESNIIINDKPVTEEAPNEQCINSTNMNADTNDNDNEQNLNGHMDDNE